MHRVAGKHDLNSVIRPEGRRRKDHCFSAVNQSKFDFYDDGDKHPRSAREYQSVFLDDPLPFYISDALCPIVKLEIFAVNVRL